MANAIYSNARAVALENYLLGRERLSRAAECTDVKDALKVFSEVGFGTSGEDADTEKVISVEREKLFSFIKETCPNKYFGKFFLLENDYRNAQALIKCKYLKISADGLLTESGNYDRATLKEKIDTDDYSSFEEPLKDALCTADALFTTGHATGIAVDALFKKAYYRHAGIIAKKFRPLFDIFKVQAECENIGVALRTRDFAFAKRMFIDTPSYNQDFYRALCEEDFETLKKSYKTVLEVIPVLSALEDAAEDKPLERFERFSKNYPLTYLSKYRYSSGGIYPFMLYCYYKKAEIENARLILSGIVNGQSPAEIKGRLEDSYEG